MKHWSLTFLQCLDYSRFDEITAEITLASSASSASVAAKVDTGSKNCIFQPRFAELLELDLTSGIRQRFRTAAGSFIAYGHEVKLGVGDLEWTTTVYFAEAEDFPVNVVGRIGFLDRLQIGLVDYEQRLYLSSYGAA